MRLRRLYDMSGDIVCTFRDCKMDEAMFIRRAMELGMLIYFENHGNVTEMLEVSCAASCGQRQGML